MARQVMVDLDELDHLMRAATHGRIGLTAALAQLTATSATPVHADDRSVQPVAARPRPRPAPERPHRIALPAGVLPAGGRGLCSPGLEY